MEYPRKDELSKIFPELEETKAKDLLQKEVDFKPEVLATCRYKECQIVHDKSDKSSVMKWKAQICVQDLDYKGFYTTDCTEKCHIDFHPWCWKCKKDCDGIKNDKDYLKQNCPTPDCGAPISEITIVKDDPENPIKFKDEKLTERRLIEFNKKKQKVI